jgi:tetratricopeptide (TPR) repeat protein
MFHYIKYIIIGIILGAVFSVTEIDIVFGMVVTFFGIVIIEIAIIAYSVTKSRGLVRYISDCEPDEYLRQSAPYFKKFAKNKELMPELALNTAVAYYCKGELEKSIEMLKNITSKNKYVRFFISYNLSVIIRENGDAAAAEFYYKQTRENLSFKKSRAEVKIIDHYMSLLDSLFDDDTHRALRFFSQRFEDAPDLYQKVSLKYESALLYEKLNDLQNQRECLQYVAEQGKEIHIVKLAREKLADYENNKQATD